MNRFNNIIPPTDLTNSREYYGMYNSRDFYRGTSFKMSGEWAPNTHYFNDEYIVDFVTFGGALLSCTKSHLSSDGNSGAADIPVLKYNEKRNIIGIEYNPYWTYVMSGTEGPEGKVWAPHVSSDGVLTWTKEDASPESFVIKGEKGDSGPAPIINVREKDGTLVWTSDGKDILDPLTGQPLEAKGQKGDTGANGKVYVPSNILNNKSLLFTLSSDTIDPTISVDLSSLKGDDGQTPIFTLNEKGDLSYFYEDDRELRSIGNIMGPKGVEGDKGEKGDKGDKGEKGDRGNVGPSQELKIEFDSSIGMSILYCRTKGTSEWIRLGPVGGSPGKSPKLIRVLSTADNADHQDSTKRNDRILWGYDGVPVSEWTTLCYLDELKGDQNIVIGCPNNLNGYYGEYDEYGGPADHDKIWYDPCDVSGPFSTTDFLYQSYLDACSDAGVSEDSILSKEDFLLGFSSLTPISGFNIQFAGSFDSLGEPDNEKSGTLWLVPSDNSGEHNKYDEYIVVYDTISKLYSWEKWGTQEMTINIDDYYTKNDIDNKFTWDKL